MTPPPVLSEVEQRAWEAWQKDHTDTREFKTWHELPYWVQQAYVNYLVMA